MIISDPTANSFHIQIYPKILQDAISEDIQSSNKREENIFNYLRKLLLGEKIQIPKEELQQLNEIDISNSTKLKEFTATSIYSIFQITEILDNDEIRRKLYKRLFEYILCNSNTNQPESESITKEMIENKINNLNCIEKILGLFQLFR